MTSDAQREKWLRERELTSVIMGTFFFILTYGLLVAHFGLLSLVWGWLPGVVVGIAVGWLMQIPACAVAILMLFEVVLGLLALM